MKRSVKDVLPGVRFGMLTVLRLMPKTKGKRRVHCRCDCGSEIAVGLYSIAYNNTRSCGCKHGRRNNKAMPGAVFGHLTIIERLPKVWVGSRYSYRIRCSCDCGNETVQEITPVVKGLSKSCGCRQTEAISKMSRQRSITAAGTGQVIPGAKFGRLTVIERIEENGLLTNSVRCSCDCGNTTRSEIDGLWRGLTKSCGCLQSELLTERNRKNAKYGCFQRRYPRTHGAWSSMMNRCTNPNSLAYPKYGGVGIRVCQYLRDPRNLKDLIGNRPSRKHSIDRFPKWDGNYCCGNCEECRANSWDLNIRWATPDEQANNKSNNIRLTAFGKTLTKTQWSRLSGLKFSTLHNRLSRGWSVEKALTTPDKKGHCYRPDTECGSVSV